jgi:hypothetical protein
LIHLPIIQKAYQANGGAPQGESGMQSGMPSGMPSDVPASNEDDLD